MIKIKNILKDSTADKLGIKPGDIILSINGDKITDYIEYNYKISDYKFDLEVKKKSGQIITYTVKRDFNKKLGIEFDNIIFDGLNICKNNCIFCFVDQQPEGLRDTLNIKDDDYRFSFLQGSYITLTNLKQKDYERIIKYNLSPLNISVHSTDPKLRYQMMKNPKAKEINKQLACLKRNNINFNTQIVLCPGINDGVNLDKSIEDLSKYYPNILSLAVVPVGLTKYKNERLRTYKKEEVKKILNQIDQWQDRIYNKYGENFLYASDEFYLTADNNIPEYDHYNQFLQLENGIGITRIFRDNYQQHYKKRVKDLNNNTNYTKYHILTSVLGKKAIEPVINDINKNQKKVRLEIEVVNNSYFGLTVTVAGLLTSKDLLKKINKNKYQNVIIPKVTLNDNDKFLDNISIAEFKNKVKDSNIYISDGIGDLMEVLIDG
ncbi:MAG: DUF512 domain-containing protein [Halanaerobiales bacterium]|nr:DUF512 domain-containing protein [Halanaerobiales bacterium]